MDYLDKLHSSQLKKMKKKGVDDSSGFSLSSIKQNIHEAILNQLDLFSILPNGSTHGPQVWTDMNENFWLSVQNFKIQNGESWTDCEKSKEDYFSELLSVKRESYFVWLSYLDSLGEGVSPKLIDWILRGLLTIGTFNSTTKKFSLRRHDDMRPYIYLFDDCLLEVISVINKKSIDINYTFETDELNNIFENDNFPSFKTLYQYFYARKVKDQIADAELFSITSGKWVEFNSESDADHLLLILNKYPELTWCIKQEEFARGFLKYGSLHIYFSEVPTAPKYSQWFEFGYPRLCIRKCGDFFAEKPRGVSKSQDLDPIISKTSILKEKLEEFGSQGRSCIKICSNLDRFNHIKLKLAAGKELSEDELYFILKLRPYFFGTRRNEEVMRQKYFVLENYPDINLVGADLRFLDLRRIDFRGRDVSGVNLSFARVDNDSFVFARNIIQTEMNDKTRLPWDMEVSVLWFFFNTNQRYSEHKICINNYECFFNFVLDSDFHKYYSTNETDKKDSNLLEVEEDNLSFCFSKSIFSNYS